MRHAFVSIEGSACHVASGGEFHEFLRRFLIAPALARLIRRERGSSKYIEGYFALQAGRVSFVRIAGDVCELILSTTDTEGGTNEERTEVPRPHGDALLDVCNAKIVFDRTDVPIDGRTFSIDRYSSPTGLDVVSIVFGDLASSQTFHPPIWFGNEVSDEPAFGPAAVATDGVPARNEVSPSNSALDAVLDLLEPRLGLRVFDRARAAA